MMSSVGSVTYEPTVLGQCATSWRTVILENLPPEICLHMLLELNEYRNGGYFD